MKISDLADHSQKSFPQQEPVAIIGVGCRYSGEINNLEDFWKVLVEKKSTLKDVPEDRFPNIDQLQDSDRGYRKIVSKQGGWLNNLKDFDAKFFKISPREAEKVDPHQRLMLEVTYEAFEDAGLKLEDVWGSRTGVYAGMWSSDFEHILANSKDDIDVYSTTGSGRYAAAGRLAYYFNLQGPTFTIDTACSTSLVAIHLASQSLHLKECDLAVCSAANLILDPFISIGYSRSRLLSDYGKCRFGAKDASGYVRTEGAATVILKRLSDAERDGDFIYGVIPGSACNSDGQSHKHMLAPSAITQEIMIKDALSRAHIEPKMIQYVEAHGTGTKAGDPAEIASISGALSEGRDPDDIFYVGSIKTNLGHTEAASGVAGLIKILLAIQHKTIPANLYADGERNPDIPWDKLSLKIPSEHTPWPHPERPLLAGLNSFGISGTNAHVIVQEPPQRNIKKKGVTRKYKILPVSAANEKALQEYCKLYLPLFENANTEEEWLNLVKNIAIRKVDLPYRAAIIFENRDDIIQALQNIAKGQEADNIYIGYTEEKKRTALVFPGQGAQWSGMGKELYSKEPAFKTAIDKISDAYSRYVDWNLKDELFAEDGLKDIDIIQPALLAIEIALAEWWKSIGLNFKAVVGHSMGEVGAAYLAGAISLDAAAAIICTRSQLMKRTSGQGAMAYIALSPDVVKAQFSNDDIVGIGVQNSPSSCVISGEPREVDRICLYFETQGAFVRKVKVDVASHSPQMQPLVSELQEELNWIEPTNTSIEIFSSVEAKEVSGDTLNAAYWTKNLRNTVRFAETVQLMIQETYGHFVEVSPHPTLLQPIQENAESLGVEVEAVGSMEREKDAHFVLMQQVAKYFANGGRISWKKFYDLDFTKVLLPTYPWQRVRYWVEENSGTGRRVILNTSGKISLHPLLQSKIEVPEGSEFHVWETELSLKDLKYLKDHKIQDTVVFPGAAYIEMIWAALHEKFGSGGHLIQSLSLKSALPLTEEKDVTVQLILTQQIADTYKVEIYSVQNEDGEVQWVEHAEGIVHLNATKDRLLPNSLPVEVIEGIVQDHVITQEEHYQQTTSISLPYGPAFQTVKSLRTGENFILAEIQSDSIIQNAVNKYFVHPAVLDGFIQTFLSAVYNDQDKGTFVPVSIGKLLLHHYEKDIASGTIVVKLTSDHYDQLIGNAVVYNSEGKALLEMRDVEFTRLEQNVEEEPSIENVLYHAVDVEIEKPQRSNKKVVLFAADDLPDSFIQTIQPVAIIKKGNFFQANGQEWIIDSSNRSDYQKVFHALKGSFDTIVHTWNIDEKKVAGIEPQEHTTLSIVRSIQVCAELDMTPRIWVMTDAVEQFPAQATAIGLLNVVRNEHPEFNISSIQVTDQVYSNAVDVLLSDTKENSWKERENVFYVERLHKLSIEATSESTPKKVEVGDTPFEVVTTEPGLLSNITIQKKHIAPLQAHEVRVAVKAIGINFMNLMSALGIYPGKENGFATLGIECAGVVEAVGEEVTHLQVGDRVFGMAYHTMSSHIHVHAALMQLIPDNLSFEEAATIPVVYLTVFYGLGVQARLQAGERVLIHSATGGVGLAAIQFAQLVGAEIYATAGSPEKRELLKSMGVQYVYDSRSLDFADRIMQDTSDEGVDVVLNSLTGSAMVKSLELLRNFGRFVEIGKKDVYDNSRIGLEAFTKGLSYFMIDFEKMIFEKPVLVGELLYELVPLFESEKLKPLPSKIFHVSQAKEAFEYMSKSQHIGKIIVEINSENVFFDEISSHLFVPDATYLITGGYGGLGLTFAKYLVEQGARRLVLTGRTGQSDHPVIEELRALGAEIIIDKADVSEREDVERILSIHHTNDQPFKGVFHLAGILDDASILNLNEDAYYRVLSPKVMGAYNLHIETQKYDLDHFVLFSSSTILFGSPGQAAYVAANRYMDALIAYRHRLGLNGMAIQWGTVSDVGLAASAENRSDRLKEEGVAPLTPQECTEIFDIIAPLGEPVVGAFRFEIDKWEKAYPSAAKNPFYEYLRAESPSSDDEYSALKEVSNIDILKQIIDIEQRHTALENQLKDIVGKVVKLQAEDIHSKTTFKSLGIDSLMSIQLKNQLEKTYQTSLSVTAFWTHSNIKDYAKFLLEKLKLNVAETTTTPIVEKVQEVKSEMLSEVKDAPMTIGIEETKVQENSQTLSLQDIEVEDLSIDELSKLLDDELNDLL